MYHCLFVLSFYGISSIIPSPFVRWRPVRNKNTFTNHLHEFYLSGHFYVVLYMEKTLFLDVSCCFDLSGHKQFHLFGFFYFTKLRKKKMHGLWPMYMCTLNPKHKSSWLIKPRKKMIKFLWSFLLTDFEDSGLKKSSKFAFNVVCQNNSNIYHYFKILKGLIHVVLNFCNGTESTHWRSWIRVLCSIW